MKRITLALLACSMILMGCGSTYSIKNNVEIRSMGKYPECELGSGSFMIHSAFGGDLVKKDFSAMLFPKKGLAGLVYKKSMNKERLLLDKTAREAIIRGADFYLKDFEEKNLDKKQRKRSSENYGAFRARVEWGTLSYTYNSEPAATMGYIFIPGKDGKLSPYFVISIKAQRGNHIVDGIDSSFPGLDIFMTRSQLKDLVAAISEEEIASALSSVMAPDDSESEYYESDDTGEQPDENEDYIEAE